eukprot:CAMPEP_0194139512 /NCGR_PEP_ID=MMETSP0152-20130528/9144_1 /TAXON_ID=1049557 /ORGANISM="Thalassiothrix antarctica, Strain L6-D1" /LENGTH=711 /DNA_ID=CAMNT_0038837375 /DNA_START=519 /DNA_END=2654 /DNA_ORIENTATION=-
MKRSLMVPLGDWTNPMIIMMSGLCLEMLAVRMVGIRVRFFIFSAAKPIAIFKYSEKARNAFRALKRIVPIVVQVLALELFLILSFAAVACTLYSDFDSFHNLSTAWLSLFQLSTTVVNPSIWMPMYNESRNAGFFFVTFDTVTILYLHSLVLSVVFQTYVQASTEIHERTLTEREETIQLCFMSLQGLKSSKSQVDIESIQQVLQYVRPYYDEMKINTLVEIVDPSDIGFVDYPTFRTTIRKALNASIRSRPTQNALAFLVEMIAIFVATANCAYVILLTSNFEAEWFDLITYPTGALITLLGTFELLVRANPFRLIHFTPVTRLNPTFDGLATLAALLSIWGLFHYKYQLQLMITGRAIDMIRIMRFQKMFRDVVDRCGDVVPALEGPLALVISTHHLYVYLGMSIWGGAILVGKNVGVITPLYDLNNFNSYMEGFVTMFQVLIINDWHGISEVYLYATRHANPYIVYPFFVGANLISVNIMLHCMTAFFVGAFITKLDETKSDEERGAIMKELKDEGDSTIDSSSRSIPKLPLARNSSSASLYSLNFPTVPFARNSSCASLYSLNFPTEEMEDDSQDYEVVERQGFDTILRTVTGSNNENADDYIKEVGKMLETFEYLTEGQVNISYMLCCQQTMTRFGNQRFENIAKEYLGTDERHTIVNDMHARLLSPSNMNDSIAQNVTKNECTLRFTASLVHDQPAISMIVLRII